jgi:N-acetyl-anhydromuramyl-L-alanine amidase AmpD
VLSSDDYARAVIAEGLRRNITDHGIVIALATVLVESGNPIKMWANHKVPESLELPHDAVGSDGYSVGLFQQQVRQGPQGRWWWGDAATCMDPTKSAGLFYERLITRDYNNGDPGEHAQAIQKSAFPHRYSQRMGDAQQIYDRLAATTGGTVPGVIDNRPDFNEYEMFSDNCHGRGGTKVDLFLLHTQEGNGNADSLARWMQGQQVSYHYTVSMDPDDKGVTVVDVVDTDLASWSVLSANNRSINLCFAGSFAGWTRQQWIDKAGRAIVVAAYLAAQDTKKYGIAQRVILPPYRIAPPGVSDHRYVTQFLRDGTHTDVGDNFPWDIFEKAFAQYAGTAAQQAPVIKPPQGLSDRKLLEDIWEQLRGVSGEGWQQLGTNDKGENLTLVDAVAKLLKESTA